LGTTNGFATMLLSREMRLRRAVPNADHGKVWDKK
jgi:hypothetical protein